MTCEQLYDFYESGSYVSGLGLSMLLFLAPFGGLFLLSCLAWALWGLYRYFKSDRLNLRPPNIIKSPQDLYKSIRAALEARRQAKFRKQRKAKQRGIGPSGEELSMEDVVVAAPEEGHVKDTESV